MRHFLTLLLFIPLTLFAQKPADLNKAVFNVFTYDNTGRLIGNAYGFYVNTAEGNIEAVAPYTLFRGASRATVINWQGQESNVVRILGASASHDLVRFTTDAPTKKLVALAPAAAPATKGQSLRVGYYTTDKKALPETASVTSADPFEEGFYYELSAANDNRFFGCPVIDDAGGVLAVVQQNVQKDATTACANDIAHALRLSTNAMSALGRELTDIRIAKAIPTESEEEAFSYVYMLLRSQQDSALVVTATDDFIAAYPTSSKVLAERANFYYNHGDYARADADLQRAIAIGGPQLSEVYNTQSTLMLNHAVNHPASTWTAWTLPTALEAAEKAYAAQPLPIYRLRQADVLTAMERYADAHEVYNEVCATDIANHETFYLAANTLELSGGDPERVTALLDSVVARLPRPLTAGAAPYIFEQARHHDLIGNYRRAIQSYNDYETLVGTQNLTDKFYMIRMEANASAKMYQQALDDATTAINRAATPADKADNMLEQALLYYKVGYFDECVKVCEEALAIAPDAAETHKLCGMAYGRKDQKALAQQHLKKAKDLGAENVDALLEKYK